MKDYPEDLRNVQLGIDRAYACYQERNKEAQASARAQIAIAEALLAIALRLDKFCARNDPDSPLFHVG